MKTIGLLLTLPTLALLVLTAACAAEPAKVATKQVVLTRRSYDEFQTWLKAQQGKIVIVDCWATYCAPCKKEFPKLVALSEKYAPNEVLFASLSFDYDETVTPAESDRPALEFLNKQNAVAVQNVLVTLDADELHKKLGLTSIPSVLVYDRAGKVKLFDGTTPGKPLDYAQVEAYVESLRRSKEE